MATVVIMPRQGQSVESCVITKWEKKVGDEVHVGDVLFTYETDKAAFEEEAKVDGTLLAVFFQEEDDVPCLTNVAVIGTPGEDVSGFAPEGANDAPAAEPAAAAPASAPAAAAPAVPAAVAPSSVTGVSPRAREAADRMHIDLGAVTPSGPRGRVIERDILAARNAEPMTAAPVADAGPGYHDEKMTHLRKVIAKAMFGSLTSMAQLTHNASFDATSIMDFRAGLKTAPESMGLPKITVNDVILYAVSRVLKNHPDLNANLLNGDTMRYFDHVHLGMAVDTPRGLLVPTIFNADTKSLAEISVEAKALAKAAQEGSINPDLLSGGSFTVTNLGSLGVESFTPVINPPQTGILGVDCVIDRVRMVDGQVTVYPAMGLSLTYDHRALDGAPASRFLQELVKALENFPALLAM